MLSKCNGAFLVLTALAVSSLAALPQQMKIGESTPGTSLRVKPSQSVALRGSVTVLGQESAAYFLRAEGFPSREKLHLLLSGPGLHVDSAARVEVFVEDDGEVRKYGSKNPYALMLPSKPAGLTYVIGLATVDGNRVAWVRFTSHPVQARDGACQVTAEAENGSGEAYQLAAKGFQPREELRIETQWDKERQEGSGRVRDDGTWQGRIMLAQPDKKPLKAKVTLVAQSCKLTLSLERLPPTVSKK